MKEVHNEEVDIEVLEFKGKEPRYDVWTLKLKCSCPGRENSQEEFRMSFLKAKNFIEDGDLTRKALKKIRNRYLEIVEENSEQTTAFGSTSSKVKNSLDEIEGSNYNVRGPIKLEKSSTDRSKRGGEDKVEKKAKKRIKKRENEERGTSLEPF